MHKRLYCHVLNIVKLNHKLRKVSILRQIIYQKTNESYIEMIQRLFTKKNLIMSLLKDELKIIKAELAKISVRQKIIYKSIQELEIQKQEKPTDSLLTQSEVCQLYKVSISTLRRWRIDGMPFEKMGKKLYFNKVDIEKWIKKKKKTKKHD